MHNFQIQIIAFFCDMIEIDIFLYILFISRYNPSGTKGMLQIPLIWITIILNKESLLFFFSQKIKKEEQDEYQKWRNTKSVYCMHRSVIVFRVILFPNVEFFQRNFALHHTLFICLSFIPKLTDEDKGFVRMFLMTARSKCEKCSPSLVYLLQPV